VVNTYTLKESNMSDILFYGAVQRMQSDDILIVEYHFTVTAYPIAVMMQILREGNDKTYGELLQEAVGYARLHYTMLQERNN
jgi:hypothetical protein